MENTTPMLKQYQSIKQKHDDCILFFRLGDFYEMFYDDAKIASSLLDLVLTSRGAAADKKIPMCGIPFHAADSYIAKLIKAGKKVAICEQIEDPALAKGIVKRDVIRVITAGTYIDENSPDTRYIFCINSIKNNTGFAFIDSTKGVISANQLNSVKKAAEIIAKLPIYECVYPQAQTKEINELFNSPLLKGKNITLSPCDDWLFNLEIGEKSLNEHFGVKNLNGFGLENMPLAISAAAGLLEYLRQMNKQPLKHITRLNQYADDDYAFISSAACYGLDLENFVKTIDHTYTPMGRRMLMSWVYHPLKDCSAIIQRQEVVKQLKDSPKTQQRLSQLLSNTVDMDKSLSRISCGYWYAKDLLALRNILSKAPDLQQSLSSISTSNLFFWPDLSDLRDLMIKAINPELSLSKPEGTIIRPGYNQEFDQLCDLRDHANEWLKNFQKQEIEKTKISSLKVGFTSVFGYYIEISRANLSAVPQNYIRKQTLVNGERFITPELKEFEEKMLTAQDKILKLEKELVSQIHQKILACSGQLLNLSETIARIDVLLSLSLLAANPGYVLPQINDSCQIKIIDGKHPVLEKILGTDFVPNDLTLDQKDSHLLIITGPNMAGKSTYIRQAGLLVILAQIGSFIPATQALIGIVDKIFTRIGSHDEITKGQSTFMVEMSETAEILNNLTEKSLVILDEIGRGTSTFDGLSLAWAIAEYLQQAKARTLLATHYHELTGLAKTYQGVKNYNVSVKEWKDQIVFLHKIVSGGADDSYGIYVAKLAGIPKQVLTQAKHILNKLETQQNLTNTITDNISNQQLSLFSVNNDIINPDLQKITDELKELNPDNLTPLQALQKILDWKKQIEN